MVVSVIDGSPVIESGLAAKVQKELRRLAQKDEHIIFLFYTDNPFVLLCEWAVRELQAAYPQKHIERVGLLDEDIPGAARVRFTSTERFPSCAVTGADRWKWLIGRSDYVLCYLHPQMCSSKDRLTACRYAEEKLGLCYLNFASQRAWKLVCEQVPFLTKWERIAFEGILQTRLKKEVAAELGVHPTTLRSYEIAARRSLAERAFPEKREKPHMCHS